MAFHLGKDGIWSWEALLDFGFHGVLVWIANMAHSVWDLVQLYLSRGHGSADELLVSRISVHYFLAGSADRMIFSTGAVDTRQVRLF